MPETSESNFSSEITGRLRAALSPHPINIRTAVEDDAATLAALAERTFRDTFARDNSAADMDAYVALQFSEDRQRRELHDPKCFTLLVESATDLIGYAQLRASGDAPSGAAGASIELQRFYVEAVHHGTGIAHSLMRECLAAAAKRGFTWIWLGVWERNQRAIAFYHKLGFTDSGSQPFALGSDLQTDRIMSRSV